MVSVVCVVVVVFLLIVILWQHHAIKSLYEISKEQHKNFEELEKLSRYFKDEYYKTLNQQKNAER